MSGSGREKEAALDFLSPEFDPALALSTPGLEPPDPDAQPLDNVAKCRSILPAELPESLANVAKRTGSEASKLKALQFKERAAKLTQRIQESCQLSLERVTSSVKPGPIKQCLGPWMEAGWRVRVVTRHARGVRGVATGQLMAYDRFMNVVLRDVDEQYTVRVRVKRVLGMDKPCEGQLTGVAAGSSGQPAKIAREGGGGQSAGASTSLSAGGTRAAASLAPGGGGASSSSTSGGTRAASVAPGGGAARPPPKVVYRPSSVSADDDPVEPGELGVVAVPVEKVRWSHRQDHRQRRLAQVFIKGDNIVMISPAQQYSRPSEVGDKPSGEKG